MQLNVEKILKLTESLFRLGQTSSAASCKLVFRWLPRGIETTPRLMKSERKKFSNLPTRGSSN